MRLQNEMPWRRPHTHRAESFRKRSIPWLPKPLNAESSRYCQDSSDESCYPAAILAVFEQAIKRSPSISIDKEIMEGQPCINGTRIPVRSVLRALELCGSIEGVRTYYPDIDSEQVKDALYFSQVILERPRGIDETEAAY